MHKTTSVNNHKSLHLPENIIKRDGRTVPFDITKIENAIFKCFADLNTEPEIPIETLAAQAANIVIAKYPKPTVENVQDSVEIVLQVAGEFEAAKAYILYRAEHAKMRVARPIPEVVRQAYSQDEQYFPSPLQKFQFYDKYSRFNYNLGRRETWQETVDRSVDFLREISQARLPAATYERIRKSILEMKATPSMRLLAMAGEAARRQNIAIYNCSYVPVDSIDAFVEALIISMSGCGVGFSVESKYVENLPRVKRQIGGVPIKYTIPDTTEGWADAVRLGLSIWFDGGDVQFDYSQLRPAGVPLKIKGGIDYDDMEMRLSKHGDFDRENSQRWNANNSVVLPEKGLTQEEFTKFFMDMVSSGRGEPGLFSRQSARAMKPSRRLDADFGTNPCGEIMLRPYEFCNLSITVARQDDNFDSMRDKVEVATIIGTIQSMATNFPGLRPKWKENCEEERLLGVDINGQMDSPVTWDRDVKERLLHAVLETNRQTAALLGINPSASTTCVKPSGNSSQLFNCSSGIHTRWSKYYIRNVRVASHSPIYKVLKDAGVPMDPENGQTAENANTWVIHFPMKSPDGAITRKDRTAVEQCEFWLQNKLHWTEHNPSVTITYHPDEIIDLLKWTWEHLEVIGGMTFLPANDAKFAQMPYMECTQEEYDEAAAKFPPIDFSKIYRYEEEDLTTASQEVACMGGQCEVEYVPQNK
ncbi:recombinase [Candidatus Microgenomates bacterium]|nr:recombinase [Candidatus Microgenomates bacterium]